MDIKHAKELDELLSRAISNDWVGNIAHASMAKNARERELYRREHDLCGYIFKEFGYLEQSKDGLSFKISGLGRIVMEMNDNKPFEEKLKNETINSIQKLSIKAKTEREKQINRLINALTPLIGAIIGALLTYFLGKK